MLRRNEIAYKIMFGKPERNSHYEELKILKIHLTEVGV
jgi:hypothetical protein